MALTNHKSLSLVFLAAAVLLLLANNAEARRHQFVSRFCRKAPDPFFCTSTVQGARNWRQATIKAVESTVEFVKNGKPIIDGVGARAPTTLWPVSKQVMIEDCQVNYDVLMGELTAALYQVKRRGNKDEIEVKLSVPVLPECIDGLAQFSVLAPGVHKFRKQVIKHLENCFYFV